MKPRHFLLPAGGAALALLVTALPAPAAPAGSSGAATFARCAACHTATGQGVPGTYPPLGSDFRKLAAKPAGRRYLALVVTRGVSGPLTVEGKQYRNVMPAQSGLSDADVAGVLNHVGTAIARQGPAFKPFSPQEVTAARASGATMSGADVARLHSTVGGG